MFAKIKFAVLLQLNWNFLFIQLLLIWIKQSQSIHCFVPILTGVLRGVVHSRHPRGLLRGGALLHAVIDQGGQAVLQVGLDNIRVKGVIDTHTLRGGNKIWNTKYTVDSVNGKKLSEYLP